MTKLLEEITKDLAGITGIPTKISFGEPRKSTDRVLCEMTGGHKKLWYLRTLVGTERDRLDLRIRQIRLESRDMPAPPDALEELVDQYVRVSQKHHAIDILLSTSLAYEFPDFRNLNGQPIIRENGVIVMEKRQAPSLAALLGLDAGCTDPDCTTHG